MIPVCRNSLFTYYSPAFTDFNIYHGCGGVNLHQTNNFLITVEFLFGSGDDGRDYHQALKSI
jgi:hypothetical protein